MNNLESLKKNPPIEITLNSLWMSRSPLDCKEIKPVNPIGNQSRLFIGRTDAEAPVL